MSAHSSCIKYLLYAHPQILELGTFANTKYSSTSVVLRHEKGNTCDYNADRHSTNRRSGFVNVGRWCQGMTRWYRRGYFRYLSSKSPAESAQGIKNTKRGSK